MLFSYKVSSDYILKDIDIPVRKGEILLLTGVENRAFSLLGGIVSGLFPIEERIDIPNVSELIKQFSGTVELIEGEIPDKAVYLGPDPEKHLFFSRVDEEIYAQTGMSEDQSVILEPFGLNEHFLKRKISTLSGGEKMKLALAIAFSHSVDCVVLHGIVPWLDREGRRSFVQRVRRKKDDGVSIVILEQEIEFLKQIADHILFFNGRTVESYLSEKESCSEKVLRTSSRRVRSRLKRERNSQAVLRFGSVGFFYDRQEKDAFFLKNLTFDLYSSHIYGLIGDNGAGKSTIGKLVLRAEKPVKGDIRFLDRDLSLITRRELVEKICFLGQFPEQFITLSNVQQYKKYAERCGNSLSMRLLDKYFRDDKVFPVSILTPLQLKLLSVTASVSDKTRLIIFDEPTWGIDQKGESILLEMLFDIMSVLTDVSILVITHDVDFIARLNAEIFLLMNGRVSLYQDIDLVNGFFTS